MEYSTIVLSNVVSETNRRFILILEYPFGNINKTQRELKELQAIYKISDFYIFYDGRKVYAINLEPQPRARIEKISNRSTALNKQTMKKYGRQMMPISGCMYSDGRYVPSGLNYLERVVGYDKDAMSRGHYMFMAKKFDITARYKHLVGSGDICFIQNEVRVW